MVKKNQGAPALPPGTEAMFSVTSKDVVMGRGSGTQNHSGNVTYRKLVYLNKELYATSSKFDKLKISKAIVAAVREFGGKFMQADEKRGGLYYDIGDKRAWDKTSQALREGQAEIRARLAEMDPSGMSKVDEYKQIISEQTFFAYACRMLESLYHPASGDSGISAGQRHQTLNKVGVDPMSIHQAMQSQGTQSQGMHSLAAPPLPPPQVDQIYVGQAQPFDAGMTSSGANINSVSPTLSAQQPLHSSQSMQPTMQPYQGNLDSIQPLPSLEPLPYNQGLNDVATVAPAPGGNAATGSAANAPAPGVGTDAFEPLPYHQPGPYAPEHFNMNAMPAGSVDTSYVNTLTPNESVTNTGQNVQKSIDPLPYKNQNEVYDPIPIHHRSSNETFGSVFSLRKFCSEDLQLSSDEGKALMEQLNLEVDDLIRRKSDGLNQIDTQAFEDLVFEDDSMNFNGPTPEEDANPSLSHPKKERDSRLSYRDDMSLMNMSILTLEERGESESSGILGDNPKDEGSAPRKSSIIKPHRPNDTKSPKSKRTSRVSFGGKNISLMSMDDRSLSQGVDSLSVSDIDPEQSSSKQGSSEQESQSPDVSVESISRKVGFPMRKTVAAKFGGLGLPTEVDPKKDEGNAQISSLTISECTDKGSSPPHRSTGSDFTKLAGEVERPAASKHSLRGTDMSISNMSILAASNMSLGSDIDPELLS